MVKLQNWPLRLCAFVCLCLVYGAFGSPTPADIGAAEILIALSLMTAVHPPSAFRSLLTLHKMPWAMAAQLLFFYALSVPVIIGLIAGNDIGLIVRDVIPFCFLLLPLFMFRWAGDAKIAAAAVAFIGLAFAARVVVPVVVLQDSFIGIGVDPDYLSIAPTISFAAVLCGGMAGWLLYREISWRNIGLAVLLAGLAALPLAAMVVTLQRAGLGLSIAAIGFLLGIACARRPVRAAGPLILGLVVTIACAPVVIDIATSLLHKHNLVGENNRFEEASVVFDSVGGSVWSVLFGKGWGATLADPAVGGVTVNYTHNILTTYLLKTGLCGLFLVIFYLYGLCVPLWRLLWRKPIIAVALGVPVLIDLTLYASFKSLDFGLILLLVMLWGQKLQEDPA
jgi:hypothetical protein